MTGASTSQSSMSFLSASISHILYSNPDPKIASPPSYGDIADSGDSPNSRDVKIDRTTEKRPYFYYRLFHHNIRLPSWQSGATTMEIDSEEATFTGRLLPEHLPPPRTGKVLKVHVAVVEGFSPGDVESIYLPGAKSGLSGSDRINLSTGAPGSDKDYPMEIVIKEGARRAPLVPSPPPVKPYPVIWNIGLDSIGSPKVDAGTSWILESAVPPPPWKRAHAHPDREWVFVQKDAKILRYASVRLPKQALLYIDPTKPLTRIEDNNTKVTEDQYRVVVVSEGIIGFIPVQWVILEDQ
ncbi:hypothetical protein DL93DRAFT_1974079 [Clavulina sp. PMI_390]|nr:hypothetical protein DL93DRAFT_1974079 [Clavulina sp. PMI_390]